ncbi:MAG: SusC/RagA family TonB-linked outer membrane protein [Mangrovibacterium sp.]
MNSKTKMYPRIRGILMTFFLLAATGISPLLAGTPSRGGNPLEKQTGNPGKLILPSPPGTNAPGESTQQATKTVNGRVTDPQGQPLPGVTIVVKGTTTGTITGADGNYNLNNIPADAVLVFSFVGMKSQEISVAGRTSVNVTMAEEAIGLEEVVAIGYGVQKKKLTTGSTVQIGSDEIQKRSANTVYEALQGQTPGVYISQLSGQPGEDFNVNIRGLGTVGDATPLYVVDGVQVDDISYLNNADIESIDVLKDAASAAIYGSRAANGVILITTKKGKPGKATIGYDGYFGMQNIYKKPHMLNAQQYAMIQNEAAVNSGHEPYDWLNDFNIDMDAVGKGTYWLDEMLEDDALTQNHVIYANGGTEQSVYSVSLSYSNREGIIGGSDYSDFERYTFHTNTDHNIISDIVRIGQQTTFSYTKKKGIMVGNQYNNTIHDALIATPFLPVYDEEGEYAKASSWFPEESNPMASLAIKNQRRNKAGKFLGDVYIEVKPMKGLKYRSTFGLDYNLYTYRYYLPEYGLSTTDVNQMDYVDQRMTNKLSYSWENTLNYDFMIEDHSIGILAGMQARRSTGDYVYGRKKELTFDDFGHAWLDNATNTEKGQVLAEGGPEVKDNLVSYFGRINYNYKETYMFTGILRADASSRFSSKNRWGYFPSVSAGWVVSNEKFMEPAARWLDFFKLRASWGQNGNQRIDAYSYLATIASDADYEFGTSDNLNTTFVGSYQNRMPNPDVKWETSEQLDIGFDSRFFGGKLSATADYYRKTTKDWLIQVSVPSIYGVEEDPFVNGGKVRNEGFELGLSYRDKTGKLDYQVNLNFTSNDNKVLDIPNSEGIIHGPQDVMFKGMQEMNRAQVGYPIGYFWGLDMTGIFQNQEQIDNYKNSAGELIQPDAQPGDVIFVDQNDDADIDFNDNIYLGNPYPDYTMGLSFSLNYKNFDFFLSSYGSFGQQVVKSYRPIERFQYNYTTSILGRWHGEGTSNAIPRVTQGDETNGNWNYLSPLYIEDADFLRISNVTLGYDFTKLIRLEKLSQLRFYVSVQNLWTITGYSGMDPEVGYGDEDNTWGKGIDLGYYPNPRTVLVGVNVKF